MNIVTHPKIIAYRSKNSTIDSRLNEFADKKYYQENIPDGEKFLTLIHTKNYIEKIKKACKYKTTLAEVDLIPESYDIACLSVGVAIFASRQNDFAIGRLTGHHARREKASGFCLFNSIAIATQKLINDGKKVCIIDIDGHHGDGTQSIFYDSDKVLYCSIHQKNAFPGTGMSSEKGKGKGKGYTLNIPIPEKSGDNILLDALNKIVSFASDFKPNNVAITAGFDGYFTDTLLNMNFSMNGFYKSGIIIGSKFKNIFAVLGGGYHQDVGKCIHAFVSGINQKPFSSII